MRLSSGIFHARFLTKTLYAFLSFTRIDFVVKSVFAIFFKGLFLTFLHIPATDYIPSYSTLEVVLKYR